MPLKNGYKILITIFIPNEKSILIDFYHKTSTYLQVEVFFYLNYVKIVTTFTLLIVIYYFNYTIINYLLQMEFKKIEGKIENVTVKIPFPLINKINVCFHKYITYKTGMTQREACVHCLLKGYELYTSNELLEYLKIRKPISENTDDQRVVLEVPLSVSIHLEKISKELIFPNKRLVALEFMNTGVAHYEELLNK